MSNGGNDEHNKLASMWQAGKFEPVIRHIRFPHFRNLEPGLRIEFDHPITALVGANGTNKSSILRAIQGCPDGQNIGRFWFGTQLDRFPPRELPRFIHGRWSDSANEVVEVLQIRRRRLKATGESPDYFETDKPQARDGMAPMPPDAVPRAEDRTSTRWKAIEKPVAYFDFRAEISAFDKYFYHNDSDIRGRSLIKWDEQIRRRKEFLASKSKYVKVILDARHGSYKLGGKERVVEPPRKLDVNELKDVSTILGRQYDGIEIVNHRMFTVTGVTARIRTKSFRYSEAWAGSGEFAVIRLVTLVSTCTPKTLLLLDEPEVSLHPGAQGRLLEFLAQQAKKKRLQIVIATHSPTIVNGLPPQAIKVFDRRPTDGKVFLRSQRSYPADAFSVLQHETSKKTIFVEDRLAQELVRHVLRRDGEARLNSIDVKFHPGGCSTLLTRYLPQWALEERDDVLILLDGDQNRTYSPPSKEIADTDLEDAVKSFFGTKDVKFIPANTGGPTNESLRQVLDYSRKIVRFLPGQEPDAWLAYAIEPTATGVGDGKAWWNKRTKDQLGRLESETVTSDEQFFFQKQAISSIPTDNPDLKKIRDAVEYLLDK